MWGWPLTCESEIEGASPDEANPPAQVGETRPETDMDQPEISLRTLLERVESEIETANGHTVRRCRDGIGNDWVVDGAARTVSRSDFAAECHLAARQFGGRERARNFGPRVISAQQAVARAVATLRPGTPRAHA